MRDAVRDGSHDVVGERSFSPVIVPLILQTASRVSFSASTSLEMLRGSISSPESSPSVMTDGELSGEDMDPLNISSEVDALKDTRLAVCKIRGTITGEKDLSPTTSWLPSRTASRIRPYPVNRLIMNGGKLPLKVGYNDGDP